MIKRIILTLVVLLLAAPALGGETLVPASTNRDGCREWTLCDQETSAQVCGGSGNERFIRAWNEVEWTFWVGNSTETDAWTIKVYGTAPGEGYDGTWRTLINESGDLTPGTLTHHFTGVLGDVHAVIAGTVDSDQVTLKARGCEMGAIAR